MKGLRDICLVIFRTRITAMPKHVRYLYGYFCAETKSFYAASPKEGRTDISLFDQAVRVATEVRSSDIVYPVLFTISISFQLSFSVAA